MNLDIIIQQEDRTSIKLLDYSKIWYPGNPETINSMKLDILCSRIEGGRIDSPVDLMAYLTSQRIDDELYIITPELLGEGSEGFIPDGVYTLLYSVNEYQKVIKFISYFEIQEAFDKLIEDLNYTINITGNNLVKFSADTADSDIELIRLCSALIDELKMSGLENNEVKANDIMDKLQRLLQLK